MLLKGLHISLLFDCKYLMNIICKQNSIIDLFIQKDRKKCLKDMLLNTIISTSFTDARN